MNIQSAMSISIICGSQDPSRVPGTVWLAVSKIWLLRASAVAAAESGRGNVMQMASHALG
jgi:hypothetical protein